MKSLLAIYSSIFQKCENEKSDLNDEVNLICQAAEEYVEELLSKDRWIFIIKKDIDDLKASLQMRQNYIENHDGVDKKTIGIVARYKFGIDNFLFMISHEMERYGYYIDDVENSQIQEKTKSQIIPETEIIPKTEIISETGNNNEVNYKIFDGVEQKYINTYKKSFNYDEDKYTSFFVKCEGKTPYEIAEMLYNCNDFYPCRAIKAVYHVCVVPTMTDDNYITYESFLNHYKSIDNAQG
jgi:hypothetical protein